MIYCEAFLLLILLTIGILCAWNDLKKGIVPNKFILYGLGAGIIAHGILLIMGYAAYYPAWLLNMVIADGLAICMYAGKIWAGGDAKLFALCYFLVPPRLIDYGSLAYSIVPYMCIFVPAVGWTLIDSIVRFIRKEPRKGGRREKRFIWRYIRSILFVLIETTGLYSLIGLLAPGFAARQELFLSAMMIIYAYVCGQIQVMRKWYVVLLHAVPTLIAWWMGLMQVGLPPWQSYVTMILLYGLQKICGMYNYQLISTSNVRAGMILAAETVMQFQTSRVQHLPANPTEELSARITVEEASAVQRWEKSAKGKEKIWIVRKMPFAIIILLGFVIWNAVLVGGMR